MIESNRLIFNGFKQLVCELLPNNIIGHKKGNTMSYTYIDNTFLIDQQRKQF